MFSPRVAWSLALGCVAWHGIARIGQMLNVATTYELGRQPLLAAGVMVVVGMVAALMLIAVERGPQRLLLAALVAGTLAPIPQLGGAWPSIGGLAGAAILLKLRTRWSPPVVAVLFSVDALLYWEHSHATAAILGHRILMNVNISLALFAVIRLARLIQQIHAARLAAAQMLVETEKRQSARWLRSALGTQLAEVIATTRRISAASTIIPAEVSDLARTTHRAAATARRVVNTRDREQIPLLPHEAPRSNDYAVSWAASVFITMVFCAVTLLNLIWLGDPSPRAMLIAALLALTAGALHLYHGTPRPDGRVPRRWPWTLSAQALLVVPVVWAGGEALLLPHIVLLAGSATTRLRGSWLWFLTPVALAGAPVADALFSPSWNGWASANLVGGTATVMIALYALCHLPWAAKLLHQTQADFARTAVAAERSNFARDVHDMLGFHLSAMALNAELAARSSASDTSTTQERMELVLLCARRAVADLRSIRNDTEPLTAEHEIAEAASLLRTAGIRVMVEVSPGVVARFASSPTTQIVGIIVREASNNIIRHSRATQCAFRLRADRLGGMELNIVNDGAPITDEVPASARGADGGSGLANLESRVAEAGGGLTTTQLQGIFQLDARIPGRHADISRAPIRPGVRGARS